MFVVEVGSVLTTVLFLRDLGVDREENVFAGLVALWLWFTVLFANFAEAMAEGRGKAQAATLRKTGRDDGHVRRTGRDVVEEPSSQLQVGDLCVVVGRRGDPRRRRGRRGHRLGRRVGHHRRVGPGHPRVRRRPLGGHRRHPVLSDQIVVRITAKPGETFLDRMIALVEGAEPAEDAERDRAQHPARRADDHLPAGRGDAAAVRHLLRRRAGVIVLVALLVCLIPTTIGALLSAIGIAGMDRLVQRNVLAMSGRAVEAAGDVVDAAARQDRHDHPRQPPGGRVPPVPGVDETSWPSRPAASSLADETPEGRSIVVARQGALRARERADDCAGRCWCRSPRRPA